MRSRRLWHRVGPPTWRRSGTIAFIAVMGVVLVGGTAMAANLGLLSPAAPAERGYKLDVSTPALLVSLPTTDPAPSTTAESTSTPEQADVERNVEREAANDTPATAGSQRTASSQGDGRLDDD